MSNPSPPPRAAYLHVPFCTHRCGYCDFTVIARRDDLLEPYLQGLALELQRLGQPVEVDTLFLGGGTPTYLPVPLLQQLLHLVQHWFPPAAGAEISVEANPHGLNPARIEALVAGGVNRVSLGIQSFNAQALTLLERDHSPDDIAAVVRQIQPHIPNLSFDLIFGVPGLTLEAWRDTLQRAIELQPQHVSTYGLTFEKGTQFWNRREHGQLQPADEGLEHAQYLLAQELLTAAGFEQYEISSFARPGFRCRHNQTYWTGQSYFGIGPGAAGFVNGERITNHRSVTTWLKRVQAGESPVAEREILEPADRGRELLALGLRRCDGIQRQDFHRLTGFDWDELAGREIAQHVRLGTLEMIHETLRLTSQGRFVADSVLGDLLNGEASD